MTYSLRVRPAAERYVDEAVLWYSARAPQPVDRLIQELATLLSGIQDAPRMYPVAYKIRSPSAAAHLPVLRLVRR